HARRCPRAVLRDPAALRPPRRLHRAATVPRGAAAGAARPRRDVLGHGPPRARARGRVATSARRRGADGRQAGRPRRESRCALVLLHAHWTSLGLLGGLLLQSGIFFRRRFDSHESHVARFDHITRFVSTVAGSSPGPAPIPVTLTCGTDEENLDNNRFLAEALAARG